MDWDSGRDGGAVARVLRWVEAGERGTVVCFAAVLCYLSLATILSTHTSITHCQTAHAMRCGAGAVPRLPRPPVHDAELLWTSLTLNLS